VSQAVGGQPGGSGVLPQQQHSDGPPPKREASPAGIRVHVIEPGRFPTTDFGFNIVRPDGWEGSAFEAKALSLREALTNFDSDEPPDPQAVADAVAFAATDPEAPFRIAVGADAHLILRAKSSMSFEDFERAMRSATNWYVLRNLRNVRLHSGGSSTACAQVNDRLTAFRAGRRASHVPHR
jgi:hypothetical protein